MTLVPSSGYEVLRDMRNPCSSLECGNSPGYVVSREGDPAWERGQSQIKARVGLESSHYLYITD